MEWVGWLIGVGSLLLGVVQGLILYLVSKINRQQEERFKDIKKQLNTLGEFKDAVLKSYPTRDEISEQRSDCRDKFSNIFERLRELEKGGGLQ